MAIAECALDLSRSGPREVLRSRLVGGGVGCEISSIAAARRLRARSGWTGNADVRFGRGRTLRSPRPDAGASTSIIAGALRAPVIRDPSNSMRRREPDIGDVRRRRRGLRHLSGRVAWKITRDPADDRSDPSADPPSDSLRPDGDRDHYRPFGPFGKTWVSCCCSATRVRPRVPLPNPGWNRSGAVARRQRSGAACVVPTSEA